ncbi:PWWP domain-containing protein [Mycena sanguinolenta]|uniref:PWWP domain-containing protein n=1 Tax=Mycena sanguinolenta TaxID=230812 RepID=A0A8H6YZG0_9AGAR|nr:PWWP domain-containing protein [Mycena sanguinolenta]
MNSGKSTSKPKTVSPRIATDPKDAIQRERDRWRQRKRLVMDFAAKMAKLHLEKYRHLKVLVQANASERMVYCSRNLYADMVRGAQEQEQARGFRPLRGNKNDQGRGNVRQIGENAEAESTANVQAVNPNTGSGMRRKRTREQERTAVTESEPATVQIISKAGLENGDGECEGADEADAGAYERDESANEKGSESEERPRKKRKTDVPADEVEVEVDATLTRANTQMETAADPEAQKVHKWRQKLQKTFLGNSTHKPQATAEVMPAVDALFKALEEYGDMKAEYLNFSKIGKVLRHINRLDASKVPRDDEYHFRERAQALVDKWDEILNATPATVKATDPKEGTEAAMNVNGNGMDITMDGT